MGKNNRRQLLYRDEFHGVDIEVDSLEECDFLDWVSEAAQLGVIEDFEYQPAPVKLSEAVQYTTYDNKKRTLLREHIYSPDFMLTIDPSSSRTICKAFKLSLQQSQQKSFQVHLDVKGTFQKADGGRTFSINQKWVYQKTGVYVLKIVPKDFFAAYGCPSKCFLTRKTNKPRKAYQGLKTIREAFGIDETKEAAK